MERSSLRGEGFSPPHNVRPAPCAGMEAALGQHGVYRGRFIWLALQVLAGQRLWGAEPPPSLTGVPGANFLRVRLHLGLALWPS